MIDKTVQDEMPEVKPVRVRSRFVVVADFTASLQDDPHAARQIPQGSGLWVYDKGEMDPVEFQFGDPPAQLECRVSRQVFNKCARHCHAHGDINRR